MSPFVEEYRVQQGNPHIYEWFQWLAERIVDYDESLVRDPAYEAERDWRMPG